MRRYILYLHWHILESTISEKDFFLERLFSWGTSKEGESFLIEWNETERAIKKTYTGFRKKSNGVAHFDTNQNNFLVVGEENQIKFWDMHNMNILTTTDADGGLQIFLRLRFNKEGNLLVVATIEYKVDSATWPIMISRVC
ncbi:topless-related protein 2 isoform X2 [Lactuca sativa]|uniref:topless-related protein 2 isoform X2 n=1 Tax=Lactuca sativa TaxID=4236 RepID=UPI000CD8D66F|nr:topless-related protein 2 isoform X2 [Lactuca sativa]XP_023771841.1 topless-related protein 2 isoform X2 [Lactuca sativa]